MTAELPDPGPSDPNLQAASLPGSSLPGSILPDSMLIVRLGAIGDVVNALVFATAIKDAAPAIRIGWAVHPRALPLVADHPSVDRVHLWPHTGRAGRRRVRDEVRAAGYDLAVDLQRILKSAWLARASGAPRVLGYDRARAKELSWLLVRERIPPGDPRSHMVEQYLELARHLGLTDPRPRHLLPEDPAAAAWAAERLAQLGAPPVLVNLGASKPENRWSPERFGQLAAACGRALDAPLVLTGGAEDRPAAERALAADGAAQGRAVDLVGRTDLRQLYHLMDGARLAVSCDTGPMHLAAARGLPVVALFGPADERRTGPWGAGHRVVRARPQEHGAPFVPAPMEDLTVDAVLEAVVELVGEET